MRLYDISAADSLAALNSPKNINLLRAEKKVRADIKRLAGGMKIKTMLTPGKAIKTDADFIEKVVFPAFLKLYQNWPAGYELLMKSKLCIKEIRHPSDLFNVYYEKKLIGRTYGAIHTKVPDIVTISINKYDRYNPKTSTDSLYHELMHAIDQTGVKDKPGHIFYISRLADIKYNGALTAMAEKYCENREKAYSKICAELSGKTISFKVFCGVYKNAMLANNCWALKTPRDGEKYAEFFKRAFVIIDDKEEVLINGLMLYFGSKEEKERLRKLEPELYGIIKDFAVPMVDIRLSEFP